MVHMKVHETVQYIVSGSDHMRVHTDEKLFEYAILWFNIHD